MFPFTIEEDEFDLKKFGNSLNSNDWKEEQFDISRVEANGNRSSISNYNEYVYFYSMVQKLLYNTENTEDEISKYFELNSDLNEYHIYTINSKETKKYMFYKDSENNYFAKTIEGLEYNEIIKISDLYFINENYYIISDKKKEILDENFSLENIIEKSKYDEEIEKLKSKDLFYVKSNDYKLNISRIALRVFKTGVGILSFHLENYKYDDKESILKINDFGRRVYPQFKPIHSAKSNFLADRLMLKHLFDNSKNISENFEDSGYEYISNTIMKLLEDKFLFEELDKNEKNRFQIKPIIDDRMFTICWYGNDEFSRILKKSDWWENKKEYLKNDDWAKFIFVDGNYNSLQSKSMMEEYLTKHTYDRWINYGTLYGISRYSFVCLTDRSDFSIGVTLSHMKTMYYQIMIIALMQRATILKFKQKISKLVNDNNRKNKNKKIKELQREYLEFLNSMNFREITAQEQGIEIYNMVRDIMGINDAVRELEQEIGELHNWNLMVEQEIQNEKDRKFQDKLNIITLLGGSVGVTGMIIGILGLNDFSSVLTSDTKPELFIKGIFFIILPFLVITFGLYKLLYKTDNKQEDKEDEHKKNIKRNIRGLIILIFILYIFIIA
jgi:hypothetical protein